MYMCEFIYTQTVGGCLFMCERFLTLLHAYTVMLDDYAEMGPAGCVCVNRHFVCTCVNRAC